MNIFSLLRLATRRGRAIDGVDAEDRSDAEPLLLVSTAGDVVVTLVTLLTLAVGVFLGVSTAKGVAGYWPAVLPGMALLLLFSELFLIRRRVAAVSVVYPFLFGVFAILTSLSLPKSSATGGLVWGSLAWAATGALYWNRYKAPVAVVQFTTGLFMAIALPLFVHIVSSEPRAVGAFAARHRTDWALSALYGLVLAYGALNAWLGLCFDRLDPSRTREYSSIAYWYHAKGASGLTVGLVYPLAALTGLSVFKETTDVSFVTLVWMAIFLLVGALGLLFGLRLNRKNYSWAGAICVATGLMAVTHSVVVLLCLLLAFCMLLYEWDRCVHWARAGRCAS